MRVSELAKELGVASKEVLAQLAKLKSAAKTASSSVEESAAAKVRQALGAPTSAKTFTATVTKPTKTAATTAAKTAVATKPKVTAKAPTAAPVKKVTTPPPPAPVAKPVAPPPPAKPVAPPAAPVAPKPQPAAPAAVKSAAPPPPPPPPPTPEPVVAAAPKRLQLKFPITVKDLAEQMNVKATDLIKHLMSKKIFASLTRLLDQPTAAQIAQDFHFELAPQPTPEELFLKELEPDPAQMVPRAPVVTFMGHVDHGKTSLMDAIRQSKVVEKEAGGITQHIGAYEVVLPKGHVTLLDTPGHAAFTALRARGANITDVVVLVVAADDGVMPQTIEAIDHAKAAGVPIVVAINKIDKPEAAPEKVKQQLAQRELLAEDWGGKTIMVPVSARTGQGIDGLLEMLLLEADLLELKADPTKPAQGTVIEARQTKDRGPIATLLVQQGTLHVQDVLIVGSMMCRVRAMMNDRGHRVKEAKPGSPVEILGLPSVPKAGDKFLVINDEKLARQIVERRQEQQADRAVMAPRHITLEELHQRITAGQLKELKLILKADVQGSAEAIVQSLLKIDTKEVKLNILHTGIGDINESDVMLAAASDAIIIGFHVGADPQVQVQAISEGVDIQMFQIIYELVNSITGALEGLLEPKIEETFLGRAEVKRTFQISKVGTIAGCLVTKGAIRRDAVIRLIRGKDRVAETKISNLKRVKDDVREVQEGLECGIALESKETIQPGDLIEAWELKKVARKLN